MEGLLAADGQRKSRGQRGPIFNRGGSVLHSSKSCEMNPGALFHVFLGPVPGFKVGLVYHSTPVSSISGQSWLVLHRNHSCCNGSNSSWIRTSLARKSYGEYPPWMWDSGNLDEIY